MDPQHRAQVSTFALEDPELPEETRRSLEECRRPIVVRGRGRPPRPRIPLDEDVAAVLIDEEALQRRVAQLGRYISTKYAGKDLVLVSVLKGSVVFLADLIRHITIPHEIDFMATSSYGASTESSGVVRILKDLNKPIEGRHVLVVEDIIDSGHTLAYLLRILAARKPASLSVATLLDKPARREVEIDVEWTGFAIPNEFVIGYGLDYAERYRNLPYIGVLKPEVYQAQEVHEGEEM